MITRKWKESFMVWYGRSGREWGGAGWVGRVGYIVYIGTESIAKTIVQAQRGMLFNSHSFWHTPLAGCGGVRSGIFRSPWGLRVAFAFFMTAGQRAIVPAGSSLCLCTLRAVRARPTFVRAIRGEASLD